jgi:hypothetical protein
VSTVQALVHKRAEIAGYIHDLERRLAQHRADLAHIDAAITLFDNTVQVDAIAPKRTVHRSRYFGMGELTRCCREALRDASGPISAADIAIRALTERKLDAGDPRLRSDFILRTARALGAIKKKGQVRQIGAGKGSKWTLATN